MKSKYNEAIIAVCEENKAQMLEIFQQIDDDKYDEIVNKLEAAREGEYRETCKNLKQMRFKPLPKDMKNLMDDYDQKNKGAYEHASNTVRYYEWLKSKTPDEMTEIFNKGKAIGLSETVIKALYMAACLDIDEMRKNLSENAISLGF